MINVIQDGEQYIIRFGYDPAIVAHIKNVPGRVWNKENKYWIIPVEHLGWLINEFKGTKYETSIDIVSDEHLGENATIDPTDPTAIPDVDISDMHQYVVNGGKLYGHQIAFLKYAKSRQGKGFILADEMGCITGDSVITVNTNGKSEKLSVEQFYRRFHKLNPNSRKNTNITYRVRCLKEDMGVFGLNTVKNVLFSGVKRVYKLTLADGKTIKATADHEIYTPNGYTALQNLSVGDNVVVNGTSVCKHCGSSENLITYKYAKFFGYCKKCMYLLRDGTIYKGDEVGRRVDKFGYIVLNGKQFREHPNYKNDGLYEHHYVMSLHIGRGILPNEIVHHINGNKQDNRLDNLKLMTASEHSKLHSQENQKHLWKDHIRDDKEIIVIPRVSTISNIEYIGEEATYDIVMSEPYRNFIANGIVVHNCGKTLEVMNYAMYMKDAYYYKHCLIICCVNSAKFSWQEDIEKHTNGMEFAYILGTRRKKHGGCKYSTSGADKLKDLQTGHMYGDVNAPELPYFIILNIESLRSKNGKKYTLTDEIISLINLREINMIALDEVHKNISPKSVQGKLILDIKKKTGTNAEWIPMTGTPIVNKPTDVFTPLKLVGGHSVKSFWEWQNLFCVMGGFGGHEIVGYKNIPLLKNMLQSNMLRRLKKDVLDLPPKIHYTEYVENTAIQQELYNKVQFELISRKDEIISSLNPLSKLLKLRQCNGSPELIDATIKIKSSDYPNKNAKLARLMELVDDIVQRGEKVVIFSNWVQHLKPIYIHLSTRHKVACYTGSMSESDRQKHKRVFINNPEYKILIGTIGALGTNHTLTVANNVIFYDEPWVASDKIQGEDRCHRATSTTPVNIYTLITKGTIDEAVHKILYDKKGISDYIVDDRLELKDNPELFNLLLGK